jgi:TDG/mug DNA glycosylase family protein
MQLQLADKVPLDARLVFVGINPAIRSAQVGHYYAHPSNKFWQLLSDSSLAPRRVQAHDDDWLTSQGFGFTDVAKRPTVGAGDLARADWQDARARIMAIGSRPDCQVVAFVSKFAARAFLGDDVAIVYGPAAGIDVGGAMAWYLPSTSGQSYRDTSYEQKLAEFTRLATWLKNTDAWARS